MRVTRWDETKYGALSEAAVRKRYREALHQVFRREMDEAVSFGGSAGERVLVILSGHCALRWGQKTARLSPGDVVEVPGGPFTFSTEGPVAFMAVYRLPAELWPN